MTDVEKAAVGQYAEVFLKVQKLKARMKAAEQELKLLSPTVVAGLEKRKGRRVELDGCAVRLETIPASVSKTPTWSVYIDWAEGQLAKIDEKLVVKGKQLLEDSKKENPESTAIRVDVND